MAQLPSYFHSIRLHLWHRWRLADATWKLDLVEAKLKQSMWGIIQNMDYTPFFSKSNNAIFQFICCFGFFRFLPKALVTCYFTIPAQNTLNPTKIVLKTNLFMFVKNWEISELYENILHLLILRETMMFLATSRHYHYATWFSLMTSWNWQEHVHFIFPLFPELTTGLPWKYSLNFANFFPGVFKLVFS